MRNLKIYNWQTCNYRWSERTTQVHETHTFTSMYEVSCDQKVFVSFPQGAAKACVEIPS